MTCSRCFPGRFRTLAKEHVKRHIESESRRALLTFKVAGQRAGVPRTCYGTAAKSNRRNQPRFPIAASRLRPREGTSGEWKAGIKTVDPIQRARFRTGRPD